MEFNREDYPGDTPGHSSSGQPRGTLAGDRGMTQPTSTYRGTEGDRTIEGRAGYQSSTMHSGTGRDTSPGSTSGISGTGAYDRESTGERGLPYGEETPDVAGEYTGSSLPAGGMADPDREGRHHLETPGAMQPGSLSREPHQRQGMGPGQTATPGTSGTHPVDSGEGDDGIATTGERSGEDYPGGRRDVD
jgi:hypothetical protein